MREIRITAGGITASALLHDNATAEAIWAALPLRASANRWGDEIYFEIPVSLPEALEARDTLEPGELGYWPLGRAFCVFWGPTPASQGDEIRAYSPVNVFGRLAGDPAVLHPVPDGTPITVARGE
jgi:hypothetical protein